MGDEKESKEQKLARENGEKLTREIGQRLSREIGKRLTREIGKMAKSRPEWEAYLNIRVE